MENNLRKSGIDILGEVPWGTHFCQFYDTTQDLIELLVPYFKAGLENNEYCVWITPDEMSIDDALTALRNGISDIDKYLERKSIELFAHVDWYVKSGGFDAKETNKAWSEKLDESLAKGYDGLRANGDVSWINRTDWDNFMDYEFGLDGYFSSRPAILLCTYPLSKVGASAIFDVAHAHECVVTKRKGGWEILEEPSIKKAKAQLRRENDVLEERVKERTGELMVMIEKLRIEIDDRRQAEAQLRYEKYLSNGIIESIPGYVLLIDDNYKILLWNKQFESMFGYSADEIKSLHLVESFFYQAQKANIYQLVEKTFSTGYLSGEAEVLKKDGTSVIVYFISRSVVYKGSVCVLTIGVDITERKKAEEKLNESYLQIRSLSEHLQNIREDERARIAREIHDELGQKLTVIKMDVSWLNKKIPDSNDLLKDKLQDLFELLDATVESVRRIAYELRPYLLDLGLSAAVEWHLKEFERRSGITTVFIEPREDEEVELDELTKTGLFRIFQESLTNIARHSEANQVYVHLGRNNGQLILRIKDDGRGFDKKKIAGGRTLGILGMKERSETMGGYFAIDSEKGKGTTITVAMPVDKKPLEYDQDLDSR